jgi:hypothetical protein
MPVYFEGYPDQIMLVVEGKRPCSRIVDGVLDGGLNTDFFSEELDGFRERNPEIGTTSVNRLHIDPSSHELNVVLSGLSRVSHGETSEVGILKHLHSLQAARLLGRMVRTTNFEGEF